MRKFQCWEFVVRQILFLHFNKPIVLQGLASNYDNIYWGIKSLYTQLSSPLLIESSSKSSHNKIKQLFAAYVCLFWTYWYLLSIYKLTELCSVCLLGIHNIYFPVQSSFQNIFCNGPFHSTFLFENFYYLYIVNC